MDPKQYCEFVNNKQLRRINAIHFNPLELYLYAKSTYPEDEVQKILFEYISDSRRDGFSFDFDVESSDGIEIMKLFIKCMLNMWDYKHMDPLYFKEFFDTIAKRYLTNPVLIPIANDLFNHIIEYKWIRLQLPIGLCIYGTKADIDPKYFIDALIERFVERHSIETFLFWLSGREGLGLTIQKLAQYVVDKYDFVFTVQFGIKLIASDNTGDITED
jgi:hypothetical protein